MSQSSEHFNTMAPLTNVAAFMTLVDRLQNRGADLPGMGCFYGPSGFGKTTASLFAGNEVGACVVQMKSCWTQRKLCESICKELSLPPARTIADMVEQISEALARNQIALFIDEADFLVKRKMVEIARDIYEGSGEPVILIGEEKLPSMLKQWERVHSRVMTNAWVPAQPCDAHDFDLLVKLRCPGLEIGDDLLRRIRTAAGGSARRIVSNLEAVRERAATLNVARIGLKEWGDTQFETGEVPLPRRISA